MNFTGLVLVPTDFTEASVAALEYAVYYSNRTNAHIHLIHVANRSLLRKNVADTKEYRLRIRKKQRQLKQMKNASGGAFRISDFLVISDKDTADILLEYKTDMHILACCIGASGNSSSGMNDLGENANKLISNATFPVMTCRTVRHPIRFRNLLLPIDLTRNTHEKIDLILRFAREFDCHIHLLAVSEFLEEWTVTKKQLLRRLEDAADHIRKEGLRCSTEVIRHDYVSNSVIEYAEEIKADALVVMAGKQKPFSKLLFGSRTGKVIAGSTIPVISFRHRYSG